MTSTGSALSTVKTAFIAAAAARVASAQPAANVRVSYRQPVQADDLVDDNGVVNAVWLEGATGDSGIPYLGQNTAVTTREEFRFEFVCQYVTETDDGTHDPQQQADEGVENLFWEVGSALAANPTLGVTGPIACELDGWAHAPLPPTATAWGARIAGVVLVAHWIAAPT